MQRGHNSRDLWTNKRGRIKNRNFCFPTTLLTVEVAVHIPMQTVIRYSMEIDSLMLPLFGEVGLYFQTTQIELR